MLQTDREKIGFQGDRHPQSLLLEALQDLGWTLTLMGQANNLSKARECFAQAWARKDNAPLAAQLELAIDYAVLCLYQDQLEQVMPWIETATQLLEKVDLSAAEKTYQQLRLLYYTAQMHYRQRDWTTAKSLYHQILSDIKDAGAQAQQGYSEKEKQIEAYSLNWLVDIALQETDLMTAEQFLQQSWPIIQAQKDRRSHAFHQRSKAKLEQLKGNSAGFLDWCQKAQDSFSALGMQTQAQEMQTWLDSEFRQ